MDKYIESKYIDSDGSILKLYTDTYLTKEYYNSKGYLHRLDGPAVEFSDGEYIWYREGYVHRIGGPASRYIGYIQWQVFGKKVNIYYIYG